MEIKNTKFQKTESTRRVKNAKLGSSDAVFSLLAESAPAAAQAGSVSETAPIDSLIILQEADLTDLDQKSAKKHGKRVLDALDDIKHDLVLGAVPISKLQSLAKTLQQKKAATLDPNLKNIIDEIDLRARVEIAKYEINAQS